MVGIARFYSRHAYTLSTRALFANETLDLLAGETDGLAVDFTDTTDYLLNTWDMQMVQERNSSVDTLQSPHVFFTQSGTSPKYVNGATYGLEWSPHNILLQSQDLATTWTNNNTTETTNSTAAPDGTTTADTLTQAIATTNCYITQSFTTVSGFMYTFSVYLKASGTATDWARVILTDGTDHASRYFDLTNGVTGSTSVSGWTVANSGITSVGDGWYRCWVTTTTDNTTTIARVELAEADNDSDVQASDALIVWGAQVNRGYLPTAYIATTTAAVIGLPISYGEGLLVEPAATNTTPNSEDMSSWTADNASATSNNATAPDGSLTADTITETGGTVAHGRWKNTSLLASTTYTFSCFLKAGTRNYAGLSFNNGSLHYFSATWDLSNGTLGDTETKGSATLAGTSITSIGNGWYRCSVTGTVPSANPGVEIFISNTATPSYTSSGQALYTSGGLTVLVWGVQIETGSVATSYIPTTTASVTRAADNVNVATSAFGFSATEGTVYFDGTACSSLSAANTFGWQFDDGTANEKIRFYVDTSANPTASIIDGGAEQIGPLDAGTATASARSQMTVAWKANLVAASFDGGASVDDTTATLPTVTTLRLGADINVTHWNSVIRRFIYVPRQIEEDANTVESWRYNF